MTDIAAVATVTASALWTYASLHIMRLTRLLTHQERRMIGLVVCVLLLITVTAIHETLTGE